MEPKFESVLSRERRTGATPESHWRAHDFTRSLYPIYMAQETRRFVNEWAFRCSPRGTFPTPDCVCRTRVLAEVKGAPAPPLIHYQVFQPPATHISVAPVTRDL